MRVAWALTMVGALQQQQAAGWTTAPWPRRPPRGDSRPARCCVRRGRGGSSRTSSSSLLVIQQAVALRQAVVASSLLRRRVVRRPFKQSEGVAEELRSSRWYDDFEGDADADESYETKWRKRRVQALRMSPDLNPSELEDLFEADYLERKLWVHKPNRAFGVIFKMENCVAEMDVVPTFAAAWADVAAEFGCEPPSLQAVRDVVRRSLRDEVAIDRVFRWTHDWGAARDMARRYVELVSKRVDDLDLEPRPGLEQWLQALTKDEVPLAIVSKLPRNMLDDCLDRLGYAKFFENAIVCAEDERDRADQAFLHAAIEIQRQPSRCVVFTDQVSDLVAAHEATMRAVGLMGTHPAYELQIADLVVDDLNDLRLPAIRNIFADFDFDPIPDVLLEPSARTKTLTMTLDPEDDSEDKYY